MLKRDPLHAQTSSLNDLTCRALFSSIRLILLSFATSRRRRTKGKTMNHLDKHIVGSLLLSLLLLYFLLFPFISLLCVNVFSLLFSSLYFLPPPTSLLYESSCFLHFLLYHNFLLHLLLPLCVIASSLLRFFPLLCNVPLLPSLPPPFISITRNLSTYSCGKVKRNLSQNEMIITLVLYVNQQLVKTCSIFIRYFTW